MDVTPHELRTVGLPESWRGYRKDAVDELLDRVAGTVERLQSQVERLSERLAHTEADTGVGEADEMLRRTLLLAQRTADEAVAEAEERAARLVSEAEEQAHSLLSEARAEAETVVTDERRRLEAELGDLSRRRDALAADVEVLERWAVDHRTRLRAFVEEELAAMERPDVPEPESPPPLLLDEPSEPFEASEPSEPSVERAPGFDQPTRELSLAELAAEGVVRTSGPASHSEPRPETIEARDEVSPETLIEARDEASAEELVDLAADDTDEDDLENDLLPRRRRWLRRPAEAEPDDDFFADLRAAVAEETPLGPVDDDPTGPIDPPESDTRDAPRDAWIVDDPPEADRSDGAGEADRFDVPGAEFFDQDAVAAADEAHSFFQRRR